MSQPNDWSKATRDYKRMKAQKGVWRPVNTQSHSLAGKEKEKMDFHIGIGEREYSSVTNTKATTTENDSRKNSDNTVEESLEYNKDVEESLETSGHSVNVKVDGSLLRFVKGKGGKVQKKIEEKTGAKLGFVSTPEKTTVVVDGPSAKSVTTAAETIQQILEEAVKSPNLQYSHFISLPLAVHTELVEKLTDFQNSVLSLSGTAGKEESDSDSASNAESSEDDFEVNLNVDRDNVRVKLDVKSIIQDVNAKSQTLYSRAKWGIDKSIFIKPATFHLTVLMLKLWNNERVAAAAEVLQNVSSKIKEALEGRPIAVTLKGLLHATLMNTSHRKLKKFQRNRRNVPFDARPILERYGSKDWGEYVISEAHLSERFSYNENGYYRCCASIPFPEIAREYAAETAEEAMIAEVTAE